MYCEGTFFLLLTLWGGGLVGAGGNVLGTKHGMVS